MEIEEDELEEIWEKLGSEFKSKKFTMLSVTLYYIVVVSCPDYMKLDEIQQQLQLPIRGCLAAKCTSRESWRECRPREDSA